MDPQPVFRRASTLHGQGRIKEVEELYKRVLESDDRHYDSIFFGVHSAAAKSICRTEVLFRR